MRKIIAASVLVIVGFGIAHASEAWQAKSSPGATKGTITTILAGWKLIHFPSITAEMLMIGNAKLPIAAITDYPDSFEVRVFNGSSGDFITVRDKDHDHRYEEVEGLKDGQTLMLDGVAYKLNRTDNKWQLSSSP